MRDFVEADPSLAGNTIANPDFRRDAIFDVLGRTDMTIPVYEQSTLLACALQTETVEDPYAQLLVESAIEKHLNRFDWLEAWGKVRPAEGSPDAAHIDRLIDVGSRDVRTHQGEKAEIVDTREELLQTLGVQQSVINKWRTHVPSLRSTANIAGITRVLMEFDGNPKKYFSTYGSHLSPKPTTVREYLLTIQEQGFGVQRVIDHVSHFLTRIVTQVGETGPMWRTLDLACVPQRKGEVAILSPNEVRNRIQTLGKLGIGLEKIRAAPAIVVFKSDTVDNKFDQARHAERSLGMEEGTLQDGLTTHPIALQLGEHKSNALVKVFRLVGNESEIAALNERRGDASTGNFLTILLRMPIEAILDIAEGKLAGIPGSVVNTIWDTYSSTKTDPKKPKIFADCTKRWPGLTNDPRGRDAIDSYLKTLR